MKRNMIFFIILAHALLLTACSTNKAEISVVNTYEETPVGLIEENIDNSKEVITTTYYEMSDGSWKSGDFSYKFRLELTGRLNNAEKDTTYILLSNKDDITFEQAWKASGLSSDLNDYFDVKDTKIVAIA